MRTLLFRFAVVPLGLCLVAASSLWLATAKNSSDRVSSGLLVLYDFASADGAVVADRSGVGSPLDLEVADLEAVRRVEGSLEVTSATVIKSPGRANKIVDAVRLSGEITVEVWIESSSANNGTRATLVALSPKSSQLNLDFDQFSDRYEVRARTTETGTDGLPALRVEHDTSSEGPTHLVYTRDRTGRTRFFIDGQLALEETVAGSTEGWERFPFGLANKMDGESPWLGSFHLVAVYRRDLLAREVQQNFLAGPNFRAEVAELDDEASDADLFATEIAPLFSEKCLECHNSSRRSGGLDLSKKEVAFSGKNGAVVVPGDAAASRLIEQIDKGAMPLGRPPLLDSEKTMLREWVNGGAIWTLDEINPVAHVGPEQANDVWVQRLTVPEYIATVQSTFGVDISEDAADILPPDQRADGFKNTAYNLNVDLGHVDAYARLAQLIVSRLDVEAFAKRFSESHSLADDKLKPLIDRMGAAILRGPLEAEEFSLYQVLAAAVVSSGGRFGDVVGYLIEAMLQSPRFLYRVENQRGDGSAWPVGEYELASRLSYIVWGGPPDEELMAAARAGKLHDPVEFDRHLQRMLKDPRAVARSLQFIEEWLDLDRLENLQPNSEMFPNWDPRIAGDMRAETLEFFRDVVWEQQRPLTDLFNAQFTYVTPRLAEHYGLETDGWDSDSEVPARYDLSSTPSRGGLLTHGSVLTIGGDAGSMVTRGLFVLEELLFSEVGNPPPGLDTTPPPTSPGRSNRAISMERVESPSCGGCHSRFEPLAFGLERFDGLGSYREVDAHGNALREDGSILFPGEAEPVAYAVTAEMMDLLANSERVQQSLTRKLTQFALGRSLVDQDEPFIEAIHQEARAGGFTYASLIKAILNSDLVQTMRTEA